MNEHWCAEDEADLNGDVDLEALAGENGGIRGDVCSDLLFGNDLLGPDTRRWRLDVSDVWADPLTVGSRQEEDSALPDWSFGPWECPPSPSIELGGKKIQVEKIERPKRLPCSILNAKRGLTLIMVDAASLPAKWPWSHH